jgi:hydroxymethylpyrimidine/phosphomethylpyrimidine kinase
MGPHSVVVKGGHLQGATAVDVFYDGGEVVELTSRRWATDDTHGTGDTLAAAVTARLAWGDDLLSALTAGKEFVSGAIEHSLRLGGGFGPVNPGWRLLRGSGDVT